MNMAVHEETKSVTIRLLQSSGPDGRYSKLVIEPAGEHPNRVTIDLDAQSLGMLVGGQAVTVKAVIRGGL